MAVTATFTRNSAAYNQAGGLVRTGVPRFEAGRFGQAVMTEEGTTNLLTANQASIETDLTGFNINAAGTTLTRDTAVFWQGASSLRLDCNGTNIRQGFITSSLAVTASQTYVYTVWVRGSGVLELCLHELDSSHVWLGDTFVTITATSIWTRHMVTRAFGVAGVHARVQLRTNSLQAVTFWVDGLQLEQKPYATSWQLGGTSRAAENLTIPTAGVLSPTEGTIEFWANLGMGSMSVLVRSFNGVDNNNALGIMGTDLGSGNQNMFARIGTGTGFVQTPNIPTPRNVWHYFACRWTASGLWFTVNSTTTTVARSAVGVFDPVTWIGSNVGSVQANSLIDDLRISNRARTDTEIAAAFASGQPLPVDAGTTCLLNFDTTLRFKRTDNIVRSNSPAPGSIAWENVDLRYQNISYNLPNGNTSLRYVWWEFAHPYNLFTSNTLPTLTNDDLLLFFNRGGVAVTVPTASVVDGSLIVRESIVTDAIATNSITAEKIAANAVGVNALAAGAVVADKIAAGTIASSHINAGGITANLITSGEIDAGRVNVVSADGFMRLDGTGLAIANTVGTPLVKVGQFESVGTEAATFTRNSTAFRQDGVLVNTNLPRYEHHRFPHHRWQDLFDTDQIAAHYTSGGDVAGATAVSGGVLSYSGGAQATLLRSGLALADGEITVNTDQTHDAGVIFRHVDNANHYMLALRDDSGAIASNVQLYRRVAGAFTSVASADITWARGTVQQFRVTFHGSLIEVWHGNVWVLSVTDTTFTTGGVGLRNNHATAFRVLGWTVNQAQQGVMVEEGTTNVVRSNGGADSLFSSVTGWTAMGQGQSIANGVATLQSPDGIAVSGFQRILTNLPQNTLHSYAVRARHRDTSGTSTDLVLDLMATGYDSPNQEMHVRPAQLSTSFQTFVRNGFNSELAPASVNLRIFTFSTRPIEIDFVQLEQKAFATTITDSPRAAESLTIPTAGIFTRGNWTIEGIYTPQIPLNVGNVAKTLSAYEIDANNWLRFMVGVNGEWNFAITSGGVQRIIASANNAVLRGVPYQWQISGNGTTMRLCVNGVQVGETTYTEPVGALPANMHIGSNSTGGEQANGVISNLRISSRARTLAEHQAAFNSGQPLAVVTDVTWLSSFNNSLLRVRLNHGLQVFSAGTQTLLLDDQGIMQTWQEGGVDNVQAGAPMTLNVFLPPETRSIRRAILRFRLLPFRAYSVGATDWAGQTGWRFSEGPTFQSPTTSGMTVAGAGAHSHGISHSHEGGDHTHELLAHTHNTIYGIFTSTAATGVTVAINGVDRTTALGGPFTADQSNLNIAAFLNVGVWNTIALGSSQLGRIDATTFIQALMGV